MQKNGVGINFALVAKRARERAGFETIKELEDKGEVLMGETVPKIESKEEVGKEIFLTSIDWNTWIDEIKFKFPKSLNS